MKQQLQKLLFLLSMLSAIPSAHAAPCCAGLSALPAMITGDEAMQFSSSFSYGKVVGDALGTGEGLPVFRDDLSDNESRQVLTLNFAKILDGDRLQAGVSVPIVFNSIETRARSEKGAGLADVSLSLGYELVQELEYSSYKPRVFGFIETILPTGRSIYESNTNLASDVRGMGLWQTNAGIALVKRWSDWDATLVMKGGRVWGKTFEDLQLDGFWTLKGSVGAGYSFAEACRLGVALDPNYQSPLTTTSSIGVSESSLKLFWDTTFSFTYLIGQDESLALSYIDQTLVGPAYNTTLSRSGALAWTHRWER